SKPVVRVTQGVLQGSWKVSTHGRTYASFEGVPYARPPVGKYRFREPQHLKPWAGVWDASKTLPQCLQWDPFQQEVSGSENCLYINVHTPKLSAGASLPVVVFIHGGAFMYGAGSLYDVSHLMDRDVVAVTFNYRLGPLGFLSTGDESAPGNAGLKDQAFALQWVKNNVMMFGGNPDSVTLTGCSAGGASVHYHYLSPLSKGNFARGIAFSGAAFASWTHAVKPLQNARSLAAIVGCPTGTNRELVDCLKYRPAEVVVGAQIEMLEFPYQQMFTPFTPTVEPQGTRDAFLTQYPFLVAQAGGMHKVPLITSVTSEEGLYPAAVYQKSPDTLAYLEANWDQLASNIFEYNDTLPVNQRAGVAAKIKQRYLGNKPVSQETYPQLVQALGDRLFAVDVGKLAQIHARHSGQPTYLYRYSFRGEKSLSNMMASNDKNYGVSHADDIFHIFKFPSLSSTSSEDVRMTEALIDMIYSFSTTGNPKLTNEAPVWTPVTPGSAELSYLEIASPSRMEMKSSSDFGHRSFWDSLGFVENENYRHIRDELENLYFQGHHHHHHHHHH
uniref:Carboxylesterase-24 n=1 Tax=Epiphyas postvittana TaxID=65032 RepID=UPI0020155692|nr:Chain A, Carboxylesterase-24 [Epiphyas postvittana]7MP4_B Chain B, Carboxylesterase-24 [Epiphyas postvittana]7MP4_C Chain C, Carboxylesterase-24 [Epiphyas postvittana]7MP4_D Chain D, Carboxylesterase-24 [Epiphyas postvittana]7MP4_E Chain E, Carboxylesterase-24 [Epiphyas postvittana]7MP4_F Chain F, Carboxylesterase-24 [Epiphyas postvittana]7MP4_G Chain G, Carboxylesterase-24 [Epiphyas postvittana]7MP4_H Chain H, Carboxylesterase-24 [Epiphyas postvittana]